MRERNRLKADAVRGADSAAGSSGDQNTKERCLFFLFSSFCRLLSKEGGFGLKKVNEKPEE